MGKRGLKALEDQELLEQKYGRYVWMSVVLFGIGSVAYADLVVETVSLGLLYLFPLALSATVHRWTTAVALAFVCAGLRNWLGPFEPTGLAHIARLLLTVVGYVFVVTVLHRLGRQRRRLDEVIRRQKDELVREMDLAAAVQQRLLPSEHVRFAGLEVAARMHPARIVGGDHYDFVQLPSGELGVLIADMSGKGVAAALLVSALGSALRLEVPRAAGPDQLLARINTILCKTTVEGR